MGNTNLLEGNIYLLSFVFVKTAWLKWKLEGRGKEEETRNNLERREECKR